VIALTLGACGSASEGEKASRVIAGTSYGDIPASFDACADGEGGIIAAWGAHESLMVARFDTRERSWSTPSLLFRSPVVLRDAFLASQGQEIHLLAARRLRHWVSLDAGRHWEERSPVYADSMSEFNACKVAFLGSDSILVVAMRITVPVFNPKPLFLEATEVWRNSAEAVQSIAVLDSGAYMQAPPAVFLHGSREEIYFAFNRPVTSVKPDGNTVTSRDGSIFETWRPARDSLWSRPERITGCTGSHINASSVWGGGKITGFGILPDRTRLFYQSGPIFAVDLRVPKDRRTPERILSMHEDQYADFQGVFDRSGKNGWLAWIDDSRKQSERSPLTSPTGGANSDNNDLVVSKVSPDSSDRVMAGEPEFLTGSSAYVRYHRLVSTGGHTYAVWIEKTWIGESANEGQSIRIRAARLD